MRVPKGLLLSGHEKHEYLKKIHWKIIVGIIVIVLIAIFSNDHKERDFASFSLCLMAIELAVIGIVAPIIRRRIYNSEQKRN